MKRTGKGVSVTAILIFLCLIVYIFDKYLFPAGEGLLSMEVGGVVLDGTTVPGRILGFGGGAVFMQLSFIYDAFMQGEYWRIITFLFVHLFSIHILVNMLSLWIVGRKAEMLTGKIRFLILYFFIGILDLVLTDLIPLWGDSLPVSAGASGAVFGVMGFVFAYGLFHKGYFKSHFSLASRIYLVFYAIFFSYIVGDTWTACAHTIGFALGFLAGVVFCKFARKHDAGKLPEGD